MRIISGYLKGKSFKFLKNNHTRPLKDSVKESVFNILKHSKFINVKVENSNILDLYSGIGSFGLESISRGARQVTFIEKDKLAVEILKENLNKLSIINKAKIFNEMVENVLITKLQKKFNIFFLDPPFKNNNYIDNLRILKKNKLFKTNNIVVIHRERKTDDHLHEYINIIQTKQYGRSKIIFGSFM